MWNSSGTGGGGDTGVIELTGKIMVVAIILLFFVIVFVFCLHLYAKWFWQRRHENAATTTTTRRRRLDFAAGHQEITVVSSGLDPSVLKTIPIVIFDTSKFKNGLECAVCLCDVSEGEKARVLPKCNHGFHVNCIDMWFKSHSTCPLCRNPVAKELSKSGDESRSMENPSVNLDSSFPTNVLFWGDETQVSTFGSCLEDGAIAEPSTSSSMASTSNRPDRTLVIDVLRPINEEEEQKSPILTRLRSLTRLLSGNRRVNPSTPRNLDLEQGGIGQS